jgi:hypothetical protein
LPCFWPKYFSLGGNELEDGGWLGKAALKVKGFGEDGYWLGKRRGSK